MSMQFRLCVSHVDTLDGRDESRPYSSMHVFIRQTSVTKP